jgi:hypothetical protein
MAIAIAFLLDALRKCLLVALGVFVVRRSGSHRHRSMCAHRDVFACWEGWSVAYDAAAGSRIAGRAVRLRATLWSLSASLVLSMGRAFVPRASWQRCADEEHEREHEREREHEHEHEPKPKPKPKPSRWLFEHGISDGLSLLSYEPNPDLAIERWRHGKEGGSLPKRVLLAKLQVAGGSHDVTDHINRWRCSLNNAEAPVFQLKDLAKMLAARRCIKAAHCGLPMRLLCVLSDLSEEHFDEMDFVCLSC